MPASFLPKDETFRTSQRLIGTLVFTRSPSNLERLLHGTTVANRDSTMTEVQSQKEIGFVATRISRVIGALLALVISMLFANSARAGSVTLAWNASTSSGLTNYTVKYGAGSGSYTGRVDVSGATTSATVGGLSAGVTFYFVVTARSTNSMESDPSNEISYRIPTSGTNAQPTANGLTALTREDQSASITLTGNDPDSDPLSFQVMTSPANGTLSGTAPNLTYVPNANYSGTDSFTFRVNDGQTNSATATVSITVSAVNDQPTLNSLTGLTLITNPGPQTVSLSGIGSGAANESQTLTVTASHNNSSLLGAINVSYASPATTGSLSFTPNNGASGTAVVTVTVNDGGTSNNTIVRTFNVVVGTIPNMTLFIEAESGTRVSPMVVGTDANASGGQYVYSGTDEQGTVSFSLNISQADDYYVWCRVLSEFNYTDSLYATMDGANEDIYETALGTLSPNWQWTRLNGETLGNPRVFALSAGTHTLTFRSREADTFLDSLYVTSDASFVPGSVPGNNPPTLNSISNLTISEDAGQQIVSLAGIGTGAASENQTLVVTSSSSNTGLIPNPTVTYTSPNATGSLTFTPVANANGTATITVTVNDGQSQSNTVTRTFTVTVNPANDAPTLGNISNVTINEDAAQQSVSLSGIATGAANETQTLAVTASSSNTGLIPNPTVTYTSPNATGSLAFTPVANANGTATITVTVNDGQSQNNTVTRTFTVTVNAVNDAPTLATPSNVSITEDAGQQTVSLTGIGTGAANETQTLTVTASSSNTGLIPNPTVTYASPNATGSLTFTPVANANGNATITVTVNDGQSQNNTVTRTFTVYVGAVNNAPTLGTLSDITINEDSAPQSISLSGIGTGAPNETQTLTVTASSSNTGLIPNPTVTYTSPSATGSLTLTPLANANGSATITVTVSDGQSQNGTVTRTFVATVNAVNDVPTLATIANVTVNEDAAQQTVPLSGIGTGAANETQSLTVTASSSNTGLIPNPTVTYASPNATGSLVFTPVANANGTATVTVNVDDGQGQNNLSTRTFVVTVNPVNDSPTLNTLSDLLLNEDAGSQTVSLSGIGSGAVNESQTLTVTASSSNTGLIPTPTVNYSSPNATGSLMFTPATNASGSAVITVVVNDGQSQNNTLSRTFTVTVGGLNDTPTITSISDQTINENTTTTALPFNIGDAETATSSLTLSASSSNPGVVPVSGIVFGGSGANRTVTVTPGAAQNGSSQITVTVSDGNATASESFTVTVVPVNDPPTINAISNLTINEDAAPQTVNLAGISSGATNESQAVTVIATSSNPGVIPNPTVSYTSPGTTGSLTLTPAANANGTAIITVTANDGQPLNNTASRTFTVTVAAVNDTPTLDFISGISLNEDAGTQTVLLSGIGSGAANENQTLTITATSSNPSLIPNPTPAYTSPNTTGSLTFRPATNATGSATINVTINDGQGQNNTVTRSFDITINPLNDAPTITHIVDQTVNEDTPTSALAFSIGDVETPATALTVTASSSNPSLVPNSNIVLGGSGANRTVIVTPAATLSGSSVITLRVDDGSNGTAVDTFTLTVVAVNQTPTLDPISPITLNEDSGVQVVNLSGISSGAANESQLLTVTASSSSPGIIPNPTVNYISPGATATLAFTPNRNASGTANITVTVNDGQSQNSTITRSFLVTVDPVNDAPTISDISDQSITQNGATGTIPFIITDPETTSSALTLGANSSNPTLVPNASIVFGGSSSNRTVKVTPAPNQFGSAIVTVSVSDGTGGIASDSFAVIVSAVNFPPTLNPITDLTLFEDATSQTVSLTGISSGATNESQTLTIVAVSSDPSVVPNPTIVYSSPNTAGTLLFTPVANAHGNATITVTVSDGQTLNGSITRSFNITLNSVNDTPTINPIANLSLAANTSSDTVGLTGISSGAANESEDLTVTATSSNPGLIPNPTVNYFSPNTTGSLLISPTAGASGTATITVSVNDGQSQNNVAVRTFTVTVTGPNNPPTISDIADITKLLNTYPAQPSFVIGDSETPAGNLIVIASSSNPTILSTNNLVFSGSGSNRVVQLTANPNQSGFTVVTLTVIDSDGASASDSFILTIIPDNQPPTLDSPASMVIAEDSGPYIVNLTGITAGATNENQQLIIAASSSNPSIVPHPTVNYTSPNTAGTLTLNPAPGMSGSVVIYLTVDDGQTNRNTVLRSFNVTVTPVNDPPSISTIPNQLVDQNTPTASLPFAIDDPETTPYYLVLSAASSNPTLVPNANIALVGTGGNRSVTVTPAVSQSGTATITIFVSDGLLTASTAFDVTVGAGNTPPEISGVTNQVTDSYTTITNVPVLVSDQESRAEDLLLTATSYNQTVIPSTNITFSGTGTNRTMKIKPVAGKSGDVSVSLALSDGRALTRRSFQVSVLAGTAPKSRISVKKKGSGTVQPNLDGQDLTIGQAYTLTAIPAAGEIFVGWSGSITSSLPSVTFVMNTNVSLEASFTNSPYLAIKGSYNGLFHEAAEVQAATSGSFTLSTTDKGSYSGKLKLGAKSYSLRGTLGLNCKATNSIVRKGLTTLTVELAFGGEEQVAGRVTDGTWEAPLLGDRATFNSKTNPAPYLGNYTIILPGQDSSDLGPEGDGAASVKIDASGVATLAGTLADGTKVSQRVALSRRGHWPLYVPLYSGGGGIVSWLVVTDRSGDDINGLLSWIKPTVTKSKQYSGGFTNETVTLGSRYTRPIVSTDRVLIGSDFQVAFGGGNLTIPFSNSIALGDKNRFTNLSSNKLTLSVSTSSGLFTGSVQDPASGKVSKFSGALFQKQNAGSGFLLGTDRSARVVLSE